MRKIVLTLLCLALQAPLVVALATMVAVRPHVSVLRPQQSTRTIELRDERGTDQALAAKASGQFERVTNVLVKSVPIWVALPQGFAWERPASSSVRDTALTYCAQTQAIRFWRRIPRMGSEEPPWQS